MEIPILITYPRGIRIRCGRILIHEIRSELDGHLRRTRGALLLRWQHFRAASETIPRKNSTSLQLNNDVKSATRITIPRASTAKCDSRIIFSSFTLAIDHSSRTIYPRGFSHSNSTHLRVETNPTISPCEISVFQNHNSKKKKSTPRGGTQDMRVQRISVCRAYRR